MGSVHHPAEDADVSELRLDPARGVGWQERSVITLGFFFIMLIGPHQVAMGPYADWISCQEQAQLMEAEGATASMCYQSLLPSPDSTVENERDSTS